jgi:hypothetical protein
MIRSRRRACGASISSPAPSGTSDSQLKQPPDTSEKRIDPAQDFAWATGQRAAQGGAAAAAEGWEQFWLDEKVPALPGRTPKTGIGTDWLREQLDMPSDLAD